ncbi:DUF4041 domain-containing protein [Aquipseudomonas alcaligenes]|uniref:DUF4041 domain-containing protein n=1 Tax=Aquipseudomonas alcaligenes TaxID=43263 RepID=A0A2V4LQZ0_AQUAC|nr:DUF4041 domain-containing protein [Pseudomonas alcaligenes]PYC20256.1 DUF4041 domain-containing protein [Pseudomonas alcaligenes]
MELLFIGAVAALIYFVVQGAKHQKELAKVLRERNELRARLDRAAEHESKLRAEIMALHEEARVAAQRYVEQSNLLDTLRARLERYQALSDVEAEVARLSDDIKQQKDSMLRTTKQRLEQAEVRLSEALDEARRIVDAANVRAEEIAGEAFQAAGRLKELSDAADAIKHKIEGYGDAYIIPTYHLLDDLAEEIGYTEAGQKLKDARDMTRLMVKNGQAAVCDYAEPNRRATAIRFVIDAFNGKVDSILSRAKSDNHGTLEKEIRDSYALVNTNGASFRNARITEAYLSARLLELRWAATAQAIRDQEREEQRRLREQIREEEKARREYERALKDAAKEEQTLRKAMEKAQEQIAAASEAQRAEFEARLAELQEQLRQAEEKNQRALSMAQQTRTGHVYVISNIGSFGEDVFKIGMTRRLEPADRIRELGDASVPFEFDVHAMIFSEDAPGLEKQLHRHFLRQQVNKVNPRKEFFRLGLADIKQELEVLGVQTHWTMTAQAREYRETLQIEQQILENPAVAAEWTRHQMELEEVLEEAVTE